MSGETQVPKYEKPQVVAAEGVVKLTKAELLKDKEDGLTVQLQAKKYSLPVSQMRKALKVAGITTRAKSKAKTAKFEIVG